jgi:rubrerythrin
MAKEKIVKEGNRCERCNHLWVANSKEEPKVCPSCKSPYWNTPRKNKKNKGDKK